MKFSTVEIKPGGIDRKYWEVSFSDLDGDRVYEGQKPHSFGFFHYPRRMGKLKAFNLLKEHLVAEHVKSIKSLTDSLSKLKELNPK